MRMVTGTNVRFVYASSAQLMEMVMGWMIRDEDMEKFPTSNLYGWSKHKFDLLAKERGWFDQ